MTIALTANYSFRKNDMGHPERDTEIAANLDLIDSAIKDTIEDFFIFDTGMNINQLKMGAYNDPQMLSAALDPLVIGTVFNLEHSEGPSDCTDLVTLYTRAGVSGVGDSGLTVVAEAPRMDIKGECQEAYCLQAHSIHETALGLLAMATMSLKTTVKAGAFTAENSFVVGQAILNGVSPGVISCNLDRRRSVFALHIESTAPDVDSILLLTDGSGHAGAAIDANGIGGEHFLRINGTPAAYNAGFASADAQPDGSIKVEIEGHDVYLYGYATPVS